MEMKGRSNTQHGTDKAKTDESRAKTDESRVEMGKRVEMVEIFLNVWRHGH